MSDIESNEWNDKKQEVRLNPRLIERPVREKDRYEDFDDLNPPHRERDGCQRFLRYFVWMTITLVFLITMLLYWLKWR